jgi:hypothetical protein
MYVPWVIWNLCIVSAPCICGFEVNLGWTPGFACIGLLHGDYSILTGLRKSPSSHCIAGFEVKGGGIKASRLSISISQDLCVILLSLNDVCGRDGTDACGISP